MNRAIDDYTKDTLVILFERIITENLFEIVFKKVTQQHSSCVTCIYSLLHGTPLDGLKDEVCKTSISSASPSHCSFNE